MASKTRFGGKERMRKSKRILATLLALAMSVFTMVPAFAADSKDDYSTFNGKVYVDPDQSTNLSAGTTYDISLINERANGSEWEVDEDFLEDFTIKLKVTDGKSYATAKLMKKDGDYIVRITTKANTGSNDREFSFNITTKEKKSPRRSWTTDDFTFTILSDKNNVDFEITENNEEITISEGERQTVRFKDNAYRARVYVDDYAFIDLRAVDRDYFTFHMDYDDSNTKVLRNAPDDAELTFLNFRTSPTFEVSTKVGLEIQDEEKYLYEIDSNDNLKAISAKEEDGYLTFKTTKLGWYVMSDVRLNATGTSSSDKPSNSSGTSSSGTSSNNSVDYTSTKTSVSNGRMIYKEDLEELFKNAPAGGTAVLFVEDDSVMRVDDLKAVIAKYPNRAMCVVNRVNGKTMYQYRMTAAQVASIKDNDSDGLIAIGMYQFYQPTANVFDAYFTNKTYVLGHGNSKSIGTNGYYAIDMSQVDLNRNSLNLYWYDSERNYYEKIYTNYTFDKYDYMYFTAPVGYDIVITEGVLQGK